MAGAFYETDVILTVNQAWQISRNVRRRRRKVTTDVSKRWPSASIPYRFSSNDGELN